MCLESSAAVNMLLAYPETVYHCCFFILFILLAGWKRWDGVFPGRQAVKRPFLHTCACTCVYGACSMTSVVSLWSLREQIVCAPGRAKFLV